MKYTNYTNILGGAVLLIAIIGGIFFLQNQSTGSQSPEVAQGETQQEASEEVTATSTETSVETNVVVKPDTTSKPSVTQKETSTQKPVVLGPRKKAASPAAALQYFAEAITAKDYTRAASYFSAHLQAQYEVGFKEQYSDKQHPVASAYYSGVVEEVQLVEPRQGLYEIAVYPEGSELPYRPRFVFDAAVGEFVITEL